MSAFIAMVACWQWRWCWFVWQYFKAQDGRVPWPNAHNEVDGGGLAPTLNVVTGLGQGGKRGTQLSIK